MRLGVDERALRQHEVAIGLLGVGFLRVLPDEDFRVEHAVRAAGHNNPAGPEASVLRGTTEEYANESKSIAVGNIMQQSQMDTASANYLNHAGSFAMLQGVLGAAGGAATTAASTKSGIFGLTNPSVSAVSVG